MRLPTSQALEVFQTHERGTVFFHTRVWMQNNSAARRTGKEVVTIFMLCLYVEVWKHLGGYSGKDGASK